MEKTGRPKFNLHVRFITLLNAFAHVSAIAPCIAVIFLIFLLFIKDFSGFLDAYTNLVVFD